MLPKLAVAAFGLVSALSACAGEPMVRSAARAEPDVLGEVVEEMSDALWIVFQDSRNTYWFGSDGQPVYRFDGAAIVRYTTRDGLANDHIRQILEDGSGNLLFSTLGGISRFDGRRFETLVPIEGGASAWRLEPGDLWFAGSHNGPYRYDGRSLVALEFPRIALEDEFNAKFPGVPYSPYAIYTIRRDSKGAVWFGTANFGACRYDGKSFAWITEDELTELDDGPSFGLRGIIEEDDGKFWLGNLLHRYDAYPRGADAGAGAADANAPWYRKERGLVSGDANDDVGNAYFMSGLNDDRGVSWIATYRAGVWRFDGDRLTHVPVVADGQPITLYSIYEDHGGVLWLGTQADGAWRFDGRTFDRFRP